MTTITTEIAEKLLLKAGYEVNSLKQINEGSNHYVFVVTLKTGEKLICKFAKIRETEKNIGEAGLDTLFGGKLSLEREAYLFSMIKEKAGVPTPKVHGIHHSEYGTFIVLEHMDGISHKQYMKDSGYSKKAFLDSMKYLGEDFAKIQSVTFSTFGNVMVDSEIEPSGLTNFSDRFHQVIQMRIDRCMKKNVFTEKEHSLVCAFFDKKLEQLRSHFEACTSTPVLNFTDMHAENFFVDNTGHPSGYFDLESAQSAPAALEFYGFRFFLFNFYDKNCFDEAEYAFFQGYKGAGGLYAPTSVDDNQAIDFLAGCRLLELAQSYWGHIDGIRDTWGTEMKQLLFSYMENNTIDYMAIGNIWRQRDKQPFTPILE